MDTAGVAKQSTVKDGFKLRGLYMRGASVYPTRENSVKLPAEGASGSSKLFAEAGMVPG